MADQDGTSRPPGPRRGSGETGSPHGPRRGQRGRSGEGSERRSRTPGTPERRGGQRGREREGGAGSTYRVLIELPVLEKALSAGDWVRQKAPLEEILKQLRPLRLRSIEQLDPNTRGRLLTTLLRVQRQKPPPTAPAAQPAAAEPSAPAASELVPTAEAESATPAAVQPEPVDSVMAEPGAAPAASEPVPTAEAESATPAAVQPEPVDSATAEPGATPALEQAAEAGATGEPKAPIQEAAPAPKPSAEKDEKAAAYSDVMFLVGSVWRALGDESRAAFALAASGRPEEQREAVKALHRSGDWRDEAQMLESQKRLRDAARVHERHQSHAEAARLFEAGGDLKSALRSLLEAKDQAGARRLLKQIDAEQARPILESARSYELLMERYVEAGDFENVAKLYERARQYDQAGMAWERAGKLAQARRAFERAKDLGNAQRLRQLEMEKLLQRGDRLGAALLLLGDGQREQAAQTLLALPPPKAFRFLQKVKLDQEALELARREIARAEAENKPASRARWLELLGDFSSAAEAWQSAERRDKALTLYEQAGNWQRAAEMAEAIGQKDRAVELYHRAGDKVSAERLSSLTETEAAPSAPTSLVPLEGQGEER